MNRDRGKVSRSKDGLFYKIKKYPELGGRAKKFSSMISAADVYRKMAEFEEALAAGLVDAPKAPLFSVVADEWLGVQESRVSPTTYSKVYAPVVAAVNAAPLGSVDCRSLSSSDFQAFIDSEAARPGKNGGPVSRSFVNNRVIVLRLLARYLVQKGFQADDLSSSLIVPKLPQAAKITGLSREDIQHIVYAADYRKPVSVLYLVLLCQGLRIGEALALQPSDVDFSDNTIRVCKTVYNRGNTPLVKDSPKSAAGVRKIPMIAPVREMLEKHGLLYPLGDDDSFIFGLPSLSRYTDICSRYADELGLPAGFHLHQLRHSCATLLYDAGVDALAASAILGHSSYRVTAEVYTDIRRERLYDASDAVSSLLSNSVSEEHKRLTDAFLPAWGKAGMEVGDRLLIQYSPGKIVITLSNV